MNLAFVKRPAFRIALRIVLVLAALAGGIVVLNVAFQDLEPREIWRSLRGLSDAEVLALGSMWGLWLAAQGLQTASLIRDLPVRRGVVAFLGPAAVAAVVPGPSDLPVRHRMLTSWGRGSGEAALVVATAGLFSIGIRLVLPVVAAVGILVTGAPVRGILRTLVFVALVIGAALGTVAFVLASDKRTMRAGERVAPAWRGVQRLVRRKPSDDVGAGLVERRDLALATLRGRWLIAVWATSLTAAARFALLLMALRFTGVPQDTVGWAEVFVVYALVQGLTVIPVTAGEAGVSEVAYIALLTAAAGSERVNEVTAAVVIFRSLTWLLIIPTGFATLFAWRRSVRNGRSQ